ncbi:MAG: lyase family protein, partial [Candidatus Margulisbacteria bacterium]|nr:lyase family protein [Candidatus Margulisiibacteriota bacterium]
MNDKLWGGRFSEETNLDVEKFTSSLIDDVHLFKADILATRAHLHQLREKAIVTHEEAEQLENVLEQLVIEKKNGTFILDEKLEDIHMNIEKYLTDKLGDTGKKIHTGRSRNDQVVTAFKLTILD